MTTLLNVAPADNGVFGLLKQHPQIGSIEVILYEIPGVFSNFIKFEQSLKTKFEKLKLLYIIQPHVAYFSSLVNCWKSTFPLDLAEHYLYAEELHRATINIGKENIFVIKLSEIEEKQNDFYTFLNIETGFDFKLKEKTSLLEYDNTDEARKEVLKQLPRLVKMFRIDRERLKKDWGILI